MTYVTFASRWKYANASVIAIDAGVSSAETRV
jgi:hypothetical protein